MRRVLLMSTLILGSCSPTSPSAGIDVSVTPQPIIAVRQLASAGSSDGVTTWSADWNVELLRSNSKVEIRSVKSVLRSPGGLLLFEQTWEPVVADAGLRTRIPVSARYVSIGASNPQLRVVVTVKTASGDTEEIERYPPFQHPQ